MVERFSKLRTALALATFLTACSPEKPTTSGLPQYIDYKIGIERQLWPTLPPPDRALQTSLGCSLWVKKIEGSCSIVDLRGAPTVLTVGHVAASLDHFATSNNPVRMYIPGQEEYYQLNPKLFQTFGRTDDPAVIYNIEQDPTLKKQLEDLKQQGSVTALKLPSQDDFKDLPRTSGSFFTLNPFSRKMQDFSFLGNYPSGSIALESNSSELCKGDSGIALVQVGRNGSTYVMGVFAGVARAYDKTVNGISFRCSTTIIMNLPQLVAP